VKAIIEIELDIDGEWKPGDKDRLIDMIFENPGHRTWEIDEDRLDVIAKSMTVEIKGGGALAGKRSTNGGISHNQSNGQTP
jgi:hypothetical protein